MDSLRTADVFPVVASLPPKNNAPANPSSKTISVTWDLLFWCWPIRSKDRMQLEWLLATSRAGVSGTWISRLLQGFLRLKMLTSFWRSGYIGYVCDVGLWFRFIKFGNTWHKQNLDKVIATGILQGKENNTAPRLAIYFDLTSADKSWWIDCKDTSLMDSEISDNRLSIIQTPTSIATKQWTEILQVSGPDQKHITPKRITLSQSSGFLQNQSKFTSWYGNTDKRDCRPKLV